MKASEILWLHTYKEVLVIQRGGREGCRPRLVLPNSMNDFISKKIKHKTKTGLLSIVQRNVWFVRKNPKLL